MCCPLTSLNQGVLTRKWMRSRLAVECKEEKSTAELVYLCFVYVTRNSCMVDEEV